MEQQPEYRKTKYLSEIRCLVLHTAFQMQTFVENTSEIVCVRVESNPPEENWNHTEGVLWITDDGKSAEELLKAGQAVLAYLHEKNKGEDLSQVMYACEDLQDLTAEYFERVYRRYVGVPWDILETERLRLRESQVADVPVFYELYKDPEITRYMEDLYENPEEEKQYIRDYMKNMYGFYGFGVWTVIEKSTGEIIGRAGLSVREGSDVPELGFVIGLSKQKQGYGYECCEAVLRYAREELDFMEVHAFVEPDNVASIALCEKLGFAAGETMYSQGKEYIQFISTNLPTL